MTAPHVTLAGHRATAVTVHVPQQGPWFADVDLEGDPDVSGRVTLAIGQLELVGTVDARQSGTRGLQRKVRLVAGAGGWATLLSAKAYHNDLGVRARTVALDAAREAGETLVAFEPGAERIGVDYVRQIGAASRVLEDVIGGVPWWVDYDGVTHVGARTSAAVAAGLYEVLDYDPRDRLVTLAADDLRAVGIGAVLSDRLDEAQTVRELEIVVTAESVRVSAWCGGDEGGRARLPGLLRAIVERATDGRLHGTWRYRVVRMSTDRVELQSVRRIVGLPDLLPVSMWPGVAGVYADLSPGTEVLVEFIEGDRAQPIITHFVGKGGPGFVPVRLTLGASASAPNAAREGDTVQVTIPALTFLTAANGGVLNADPVEVEGVITSGSSKVGIG